MIPSPPPYFLFTTSRPRDPQVYRVLEQHFRHEDYISAGLAAADLALADTVDPTHRFQLCDSLEALQDNATSATVLVYDFEHWVSTPKAEQAAPAASIAAGERLIHAQPDRRYAISPDGIFLGLHPSQCTADFSRGIASTIDWTRIDLVDLQCQHLLSDACAATLTVKDYVDFVTQAARFIRSKNPSIKIAAQLSFRYTPPQKMIAAIKALTGTVDGFYLAYPDNNPKIPAKYCTAANLEAVLASCRPGR